MADGLAGPGAQPHFLSVEIPSAETNISSDRWKTSVTLYSMRITATARREVWAVCRRYSKFYDLRVQLAKRFPNRKLPPIPPKRRIGKEDSQFIEQRRTELEEFVNALLREPVEISLSEEVCLFLEVPEPLRLSCLEAAEERLLPEMPRTAGGATASPGAGRPEASRSSWLLARLHDHVQQGSSTVTALRVFEDWVLRTRPALSEASAQVLFRGLEQRCGLLEEVGAFEQSEVSSIMALGLVRKLLSLEYCSEANMFRSVLRRLSPSALSRMRLQQHIHRNRGQSNRLDAFRVLRSLALPPDKVAELLQDDFAHEEYARWLHDVHGRAGPGPGRAVSPRRARSPAGESPPGAAPMSPWEYRQAIEDALAAVKAGLARCSSPGGAVDGAGVAAPGCPSGAAAPAPVGGAPVDAPFAESLLGAPCEEAVASSWRRVRCPEASWHRRYGLWMAYAPAEPRTRDGCEYIVHGALSVPFSPTQVAGLLADHSAFIREALASREGALPGAVADRLQQLADGHLVAQLQGSAVLEHLRLGMRGEIFSHLVECALGTPSAPHVATRLRLVVSLHAAGAAADPSYLFLCGAAPEAEAEGDAEEPWAAPRGLHSPRGRALCPGAASPRCASPRCKRAAPPRCVSLRPCGLRVEGLGKPGARITLCALLGKDGARLISGDLLGERALLWRTLGNLLFVLEALAPLPPDFGLPLLRCAAGCGEAAALGSSSSSRSSPSTAGSPPQPAAVEVELVADGAAF